MYKKFKKLDIDDQVLSRVQDNVEAAIGQLSSTEIIQGRVLTNVKLLASTNNIVNHKLNRNLLGWTIIRQRSQAQIWDSQDSNPNPSLTLLLNTNLDVLVDIWVF
jgi:hypothetical protein